MASETPQPVVPTRYRLLALHAQGSLGRVWLAHDATLGRDVALKELKPVCAHDPEARGRFLQEAQVTSQLEHPYIVPVHEVSVEGTLYYTMTFVRGRTLEAAITEHHQSADARSFVDQRFRLLAIFLRVCEAVAYAHSRGVVHRDLKPANIMLGGFGEVFVLDWGLARIQARPDEDGREGIELAPELAGDFTVTGRVMGTPSYMAPEQAAGKVDQVDRRSDVYALGAILFKILTGESPHEGLRGGDLPGFLKRIVEAPIPSPRSIKPKTPAALDAICRRALAKDPACRYPGALELAEDVRRWTEGLPTDAYRENWGQRLARWLARHQALAQAGVFVLLAACMAAAGIIWQTWSEVRAMRRVQLGILESRVNQLHGELEASLRDLHGTTRMLAHTVRVGEFVRSLRDPEDPQREAVRRRVIQLLANAAANKPNCRRLALIGSDSDFRELVAVEHGQDQAIRVVAEKDLQSLGRSPSFVHIAEQLRAQPTDFYLSHFRKLDLPAAGDEVILMAVEHLQSDPDCWLVIQMDYQPLLARLLDSQHLDALVCDERRRTLFVNQAAPLVGWLAGQAAEPRYDAFFANPKLRALTATDFGPSQDVAYARKLFYDEHQPQRYLAVVMVAPYQEALAGQLTSRYLLLGVLVPSLLGLLGLAAFLARYLLRAPGNA